MTTYNNKKIKNFFLSTLHVLKNALAVILLILWGLLVFIISLLIDNVNDAILPLDSRPYPINSYFWFASIIGAIIAAVGAYIAIALILVLSKHMTQSLYRWAVALGSGFVGLLVIALSGLGGLNYLGCGDSCTHVSLPSSAYDTANQAIIVIVCLTIGAILAYVIRYSKFIKIPHKK